MTREEIAEKQQRLEELTQTLEGINAPRRCSMRTIIFILALLLFGNRMRPP